MLSSSMMMRACCSRPLLSVSSSLLARSSRIQRFHASSFRLLKTTTTTTFNLPDPKEASSSMDGHRWWNPPLTKIVATIGPTSEQEEPLRQVAEAGMSIMRLNFSHATKEEVELRCTNLAKAQSLNSDTACKAILLDTKGPEIRSGKLANDDTGHATIPLTAGNSIELHSDSLQQDSCTTESLYIDYPALATCLEPGMKVLLDDGAIVLTVTNVDAGIVTCTVDNTGDLRSRAGVNLPGADTSDSLPALSEKDKADILYGMMIDIDYIAASFVQTAKGVHEIRRHIQECAEQLNYNERPLPKLISKIETQSGLQNFDEILKASDGIMVARGDLGVELPLSQIINAQKQMVAACNAVGKPVIVATQMLESMTKHPRPTRAEVADVTNAVYDGADAVMTSGETAKGKYPVETIKMMREICMTSERYYAQTTTMDDGGDASAARHRYLPPHDQTPDGAIAQAAVTTSLARKDTCRAIVCVTHYGTLPPIVAAHRPNVPILTVVPNAKLGRQLQLFRGIYPFVMSHHDNDDKYYYVQAIQKAKELGFVQAGDEVVVVGVLHQDEKTHHPLGVEAAAMMICNVP